MKKGIYYGSFPGGMDGKKDFVEAVKETKQLGFDGIELCLFSEGPLNFGLGEADVAKLRKTLDSAGVQAVSVTSEELWDQFSSSDPRKQEQGRHITTRCLEVAKGLGATGILVVPGSVETETEIVPYDVAMARIEEGIREMVPVAEKNKVAIGIENVWNNLFMSPLEARDFVDRIGSEYVGWYFDVGNVVAFGFPEQWISILGKRIKKVHLKDFRKSIGTIDGFVDLLEGDVNWPAVMKALRAVGYDDYLTAEMIPGYAFAPETRLANASLAMDRIMAM
jgi:L-ribulose-5-phosphate 3-epimerase